MVIWSPTYTHTRIHPVDVALRCVRATTTSHVSLSSFKEQIYEHSNRMEYGKFTLLLTMRFDCFPLKRKSFIQSGSVTLLWLNNFSYSFREYFSQNLSGRNCRGDRTIELCTGIHFRSKMAYFSARRTDFINIFR